MEEIDACHDWADMLMCRQVTPFYLKERGQKSVYGIRWVNDTVTVLYFCMLLDVELVVEHIGELGL